MADQGEIAFVKTHLANIGALPVQFPNDSQQPPATSLRKLPIIPVGDVCFRVRVVGIMLDVASLG